MAEDPAREVRDLAAALENWLRYQRRLGRLGLPREAAADPGEAGPGEKGPARGRPPSLEDIRAEMGRCRRCKLYPGAKNLVFGDGNPDADLMFVGEAPGAEEDLQGIPFVGEAGRLLNNLLQKLGLQRQEVYITNVVKSRPPGNRDPEADEIEACLPFLKKQIEAVRPRVIVALGRIAAQALLGTREPLTRLRGRWQKYDHIRVMPTFHPSYLLWLVSEQLFG